MSTSNGAPRKIIHVDMDAFYASVEQRDFPEYRGKPIIVGGSPNSRGVVTTCSYEARPFGVRSAMACSKAARLCPEGIFVKPRFGAYKEASAHIRDIFRRYSDLIEPLSLDEAYLDLTGSTLLDGSATRIANAIRADIENELNLTASAGISYNKFLAKVASDINKPNGITIIRPEQGAAFVQQLPIGKFYGVGKVTEAKLLKAGIETGADLLPYSEAQLIDRFGRFGRYLYNVARGIDERPVSASRTRKSISKERTFAEDTTSVSYLHERLAEMAESIAAYLVEHELQASTVTLKLKYSDFSQVTRSHSATATQWTAAKLIDIGIYLLEKTDAGTKHSRLIGIGVSGLSGINKVEREHEQFRLPL